MSKPSQSPAAILLLLLNNTTPLRVFDNETAGKAPKAQPNKKQIEKLLMSGAEPQQPQHNKHANHQTHVVHQPRPSGFHHNQRRERRSEQPEAESTSNSFR